MSNAEILAELPHLKVEDRAELFERLCQLQERDLLNGAGVTDREKAVLDDAWAKLQRDGTPGVAWREALQRIRDARPA
jgi:hypothetical protein